MTEANEMAKKIKEAHAHNQRDIDEVETEANEMAKKIKEAHNRNQRDIDEVETEASGMYKGIIEHFSQGKLQDEIDMNVFKFETQMYGFSFTVKTELEAYKAAYKLQCRANQTVVKCINNEWSIDVYLMVS